MIETYEELLCFVRGMRRPGQNIRDAARFAAESQIGVVCEFLVRAIREEDPRTRCEALDLLSKLVPPLAIRMASELLSSPEPDIRRVACDILGEVGDISGEIILLNHLDSEQDPEVRFAAVSAFRRVGTAACLPFLTHLAEHDAATDFEGRTIREILPAVIEGIKCRCIIPDDVSK